jgi:hypothetical protein
MSQNDELRACIGVPLRSDKWTTKENTIVELFFQAMFALCRLHNMISPAVWPPVGHPLHDHVEATRPLGFDPTCAGSNPARASRHYI